MLGQRLRRWHNIEPKLYHTIYFVKNEKNIVYENKDLLGSRYPVVEYV